MPQPQEKMQSIPGHLFCVLDIPSATSMEITVTRVICTAQVISMMMGMSSSDGEGHDGGDVGESSGVCGKVSFFHHSRLC